MCLPLSPPISDYDSTLPPSRPARTNVPMLPTRLGPQDACKPAWRCGRTASRFASTTREGRQGAPLSLPRDLRDLVRLPPSATLCASHSFMITARGDATTFCTLPAGGSGSSSCSSRLRAAACWMNRESENPAPPAFEAPSPVCAADDPVCAADDAVCAADALIDRPSPVLVDPVPGHARHGQPIGRRLAVGSKAQLLASRHRFGFLPCHHRRVGHQLSNCLPARNV